MAPVVEFTLSNPILQETREALPEVPIWIEDEHVSPEGSPEIVLLVTGSDSDVERFKERLSTDPSITDYEFLSKYGNGDLIKIVLSEDGFRGMTYPIAVGLNITFLEVKAQGKKMRYRAQMPTLEALSKYRSHCADRDLDFQLINISQGESIEERGYGLTSRQRDVLLHALEKGYFEVPRQTSLEDLADEFDISDQALSALLRRGQKQLLRRTIGAEE